MGVEGARKNRKAYLRKEKISGTLTAKCLCGPIGMGQDGGNKKGREGVVVKGALDGGGSRKNKDVGVAKI